MQRAHNSKHLWPQPPLCLLESLATLKISYKNTTQTRLINVRISKDFRFVFFSFLFLRIINVQCSKICCPLLAHSLATHDCTPFVWMSKATAGETIHNKKMKSAQKWKICAFIFVPTALTHANELAARSTCPAHLQQSRVRVCGTGTATPCGRVGCLAAACLPGCLHDLFTHGVRVFIKL